MNDAKKYWITGVLSNKTGLWAGFGWRDIGIGGGALALMLVSSLTNQPWWLTLAIAGVGGGALVWLRTANAVGEQVADTLSSAWYRWLIRRAGMNRHATGVPVLVGAVQSLEVGATHDHPGVAMFAVTGAKPSQAYYTAMVFIYGSSRGAKDQEGEDRKAVDFSRFLNRLADPTYPVDQVDVVTRVAPDTLQAYRDQNCASWVGPAPAVAAMMSLVTEMSGQGMAVTSWLVIRMPVARLREAAFDTVVEAAHDTVDRVIALASLHGLRPWLNATPRRVGAVLRNLYDPDHSITDLSGVAGPWDGIPPWHDERQYIATDKWAHSVGIVSRDGWPWLPVDADVLDQILVAPGSHTPITVQVQFSLIARQEALEKARSASAMAEGAISQNDQKRQVSTGEETDQSTAADVAIDTIRHGSAGVSPVIRVMVSAPDWRRLRRTREEIRTRFISAGFTSVTWCDKDQPRHMGCLWPLGRGVKQ